jgi:hypothetical protein
MQMQLHTLALMFTGIVALQTSAALAEMSKPTNTQSQAFLDSDSANSTACRLLRGAIDTYDDPEYSQSTNSKYAAATARVCLKTMRANGESKMAQYPVVWVLIEACQTLKEVDQDDEIQACDGI